MGDNAKVKKVQNNTYKADISFQRSKRLLKIFLFGCCMQCCHLFILLIFQPSLFFCTRNFIPDAHGTTEKCSRFMVLVSGACVMGLREQQSTPTYTQRDVLDVRQSSKKQRERKRIDSPYQWKHKQLQTTADCHIGTTIIAGVAYDNKQTLWVCLHCAVCEGEGGWVLGDGVDDSGDVLWTVQWRSCDVVQ